MRKKRVFKKTIWDSLKSLLTPMLLTLLIIANVIVGLKQTEESARAESLRVLDEGLRKAVARCYAIEGSYPSDIEYIERHYGVRVDREKYAVYYEIFASNVMPDIVVVELQ